MYAILGMSSGIDDRPSLHNNQVTTYFVCSVKHYLHIISVNDHRDLMFKLLAFFNLGSLVRFQAFPVFNSNIFFNKCTIFTYTSTYKPAL